MDRPDLIHDRKPWSDIEVRFAMEDLHNRLDGELDLLKALGIKKAHATNERIKHEGSETLRAKFEETRLSSDKLREAHVRSRTVVGDLMLAEELAVTQYWDQKMLVDTLQKDMSMLQSLLRSAEENVRSMEGPRHRDSRTQRR